MFGTKMIKNCHNKVKNIENEIFFLKLYVKKSANGTKNWKLAINNHI